MRSTLATLTLIGLLALPGAASASDYDDSQSHPLRVAAYVVHPIGVALEWAIFRPLHALVSANPDTEYVFGHTPHGADEFSAKDSSTLN